jgi:O-antigen ligase
MSSTAEGTKDLSIQMRLNEYEAAMSEIMKYPIGGSGLSKKFSFYDPIRMIKLDSHFIHNGYMFYIYRMGIPISILFFLFILINLIKPVFLLRTVNDDFWRMALIGSLASILMMMVTNFITTTFCAREGSFILAVSISIIGIIDDKIILIKNRND